MNARTITAIRYLSTAIMTIAAIVSYDTQRHLLAGWGVDVLTAAAIPVTVDLLAILCTLAIHTEGVHPAGRKVAYRVLLAAGGASMAANFVAGDTLGSRIAHVWCVLAYLLAEWVAAKVKAAPVTAVKPGRRCSPGCRCGKHTRKTKARRPRTPRVPANPVAAVLAEMTTAPVSPAPYAA